MALEVARLAEAFAALRAGVGPLAAVDALVCLQVTQRAKALATLRAGEGLLALHVPRLPGGLDGGRASGNHGGSATHRPCRSGELRLIQGPAPKTKVAV